jgi:hypothetical protein
VAIYFTRSQVRKEKDTTVYSIYKKDPQIKKIPIDNNISFECDYVEPICTESKTLIIFVHGNGCNKDSPRNRKVAEKLDEKGFYYFIVQLNYKRRADSTSYLLNIVFRY